jgi:hypothetical protein
MSLKTPPARALRGAQAPFRHGESVFCTCAAGVSSGPFEVGWSDGAVTFVRARGGTLLALPTYRLRSAAPRA